MRNKCSMEQKNGGFMRVQIEVLTPIELFNTGGYDFVSYVAKEAADAVDEEYERILTEDEKD